MKKLLLTSDGFENHKIAEKFVELIAKDVDKAKIFFVPTAAYGEETMSYVYESEKELLDIGVLKENIIWAEDLQNTDLNDYDVIYVCGGNTFYLLNEIRNTGFDKKIINFINSGRLYVGVSAGTIIACPDASIAAPFDDNRVGLKDMSALNVIDKVITPHYQHKEKAIIDKWEKDNSYTVIRLNDGQAVVVINNNIQVI